MYSYGETLKSLADQLGVRYKTEPPAKASRLHGYIKDRILLVEQSLPEGVLPIDQELLRDLTFGLLAQNTGWSDRPDVHIARVEERRLIDLERRGGCDDQASTLQCITATDRQQANVLTPYDLAKLFGQLAEEVEHAESIHLPDDEPHLNHCPSLLPEARAVKRIRVALSVALQILVGDSKDGPRQAAAWILTGEAPPLKNGY